MGEAIDYANAHAPDVAADSPITGNANNLIGTTAGVSGTIGTGSDITFAEAGITNINQVLVPTLANNGGSTQNPSQVFNRNSVTFLND